MTIKTKIIAVALIAILLSVGLSSVSMYLYVNPILSKQIVRDNQTIVEKVTQQVSYLLEDIVTYAKGIIVNDQLQALLKRTIATQGYDYYATVQQMDTLLKEYSLLRENIIIDIVVVDKHNKVLEMSDLYSSSLSESWYDEFRNSQTYNGISKPHFVTDPSNQFHINVMTYIINIYDKENHNLYLGKLLVHLNYNAVVKPMLIDPTLGIKIMAIDNRSKNMIYSPDEKSPTVPYEILKDPLPSENVSFKKGQYYIFKSIPSIQWGLLGIISKAKINANIKYFNYAMLTIFTICMLVMPIIIYPMVANVTKPLMKLIRGMRQVSKGEFQAKIVVTSGDEIEEVAQVFNKMVTDIKDLVDESVLMEKKKRELELKMFMLQINPHFIYNTLNAVIYLARKADASDIVVLMKAFISFLQRTIKNQPDMFSSIFDEMKYIEDYTMILKYRYNERVEVIWDVDESCKAYKIPRMILYPLVENSIFHGILPASGKGWIRIRINVENGLLFVFVVDNGIGINAQTMAKLHAQMAAQSLQEDMDHIGILNVNNRLKLLFGEKSILNIKSVLNEGTQIWFSMPLTRLECQNDKNV